MTIIETTQRATAAVQPDAVRWYVLSKGWKDQESKNAAIAIFNSPNNETQIQIPQRMDEEDAYLLMDEIVRKLAKFERRSPEDVSLDLLHPFEDVLRLRVESKLSVAGTIPLNEGLKLFDGGKKMLVSAACSEVSPRASYRSKTFREVDDFVKRCQIGQTAIGSYIATIVCPRMAPPEKLMFDESEIGVAYPFVRRVTERLITALGILSAGVKSGNQKVITDGVDMGVSADLCDAISGITPPDERSTLSIDVSWSPIRRRKSEYTPVLRFAASDLDFIRSAGLKLNEQIEIEHTVVGRIIELKARTSLFTKERRQVVIRTKIENTWASVNFFLEDPEYSKACDAHRDKYDVSVKGILRRSTHAKQFHIQDPIEFKIIR